MISTDTIACLGKIVPSITITTSPNATPATCCALCRAYITCAAFVLETNQICTLLNANQGGERSAGVISGSKSATPLKADEVPAAAKTIRRTSLLSSRSTAVPPPPPPPAAVTAHCPNLSDCTTALQAALDTAGAELVRVPTLAGRQPWVVGDQVGGPSSVDPRVQANQSGIILSPASSGRTIIFEAGVEVLAKAGAFHSGQFFIGVNASNISVLGRGAVW
eukprot:SAG31_NODE_6178_length_2136_cov_0.998036_3_plen_220_part_01